MNPVANMMKKKCKLCDHSRKLDCDVLHKGFSCTKKKGHRGRHQACGITLYPTAHPVVSWIDCR